MALVKIEYDPTLSREPVKLPGSKSIAARAMICRYVRGLDTELVNLPDCNDTRELQAALSMLDSRIHDPLRRLREFGELPPASLRFDLGNGGTSLRFFTALAASLPDLEAEIDCAEGLKGRPLKPLIDELRRHGADITCLRREGYAPLLIRGRRLEDGPVMTDCGISSQFLSALLMARPLWRQRQQDVAEIEDRQENIVSAPYVRMTREVMEQFSAAPGRYVIESDWSAASYFYALALACPEKSLTIESLTDPRASIQGDSICQRLFAWLGVDTVRLDADTHGPVMLRGNTSTLGQNRKLGVPMTFDLKDSPDLTPALAVGMCLAGLPFDLENIGHLKHKESNRLVSISTELGKAGFAVEAGAQDLRWSGRRYPLKDDETYEAWDDHRIAMSMAIMAVKLKWIGIRGAEVVSKSFKDYFEQLRKVGFKINLAGGNTWKER